MYKQDGLVVRLATTLVPIPNTLCRTIRPHRRSEHCCSSRGGHPLSIAYKLTSSLFPTSVVELWCGPSRQSWAGGDIGIFFRLMTFSSISHVPKSLVSGKDPKRESCKVGNRNLIGGTCVLDTASEIRDNMKVLARLLQANNTTVSQLGQIF